MGQALVDLALVRRPTELARRTFATVAFAWVPLAFLSFTDAKLGAFLRDYPVHARLLASLPILILMERYVSRRMTATATHFVAAGLIAPEQRSRFEELLRRTQVLRDSRLAPLLIAAIAWAISFLPGGPYRGSWRENESANLWYLMVSAPVFRFLVLRWFWRVWVWQVFVFQCSRLSLRITPTHPDRRGGTGFLSDSLCSFGGLVFALAIPVAADVRLRWGDLSPADALAYLFPLGVLAVVMSLVLFTPLVAFTRRLREARVNGLLAFSALTSEQARQFENRWFGKSGTTDVLDTGEFSAVQDLDETFRNTQRMLLTPMTLRPALVVAAAALLPAIPGLIAHHELGEVLMSLANVVRG